MSKQKTCLDGTTYTIGGGKTFINGTVRDIEKGVTLVDGVTHDILFNEEFYIIGGPTSSSYTSWAKYPESFQMGSVSYSSSSDRVTNQVNRFDTGKLLVAYCTTPIDIKGYTTLHVHWKYTNVGEFVYARLWAAPSTEISSWIELGSELYGTANYINSEASISGLSTNYNRTYFLGVMQKNRGASTGGEGGILYVDKLWLD